MLAAVAGELGASSASGMCQWPELTHATRSVLRTRSLSSTYDAQLSTGSAGVACVRVY